MMKRLCAMIFTVLISSVALADDLIKPDCKMPVIPIPQASDVVVKYFNKHRDAYEKCIDKFVREQQGIVKAETNITKANAAHDAAEAAINEYNDFMAQLKERNSQTGADTNDDATKK